MNLFFVALFFFSLTFSPLHAQEDAMSYMSDELHPGKSAHMDAQERLEVLAPSSQVINDNDPLEPVNRIIFSVNDVIDRFFIDRIAAMYKGVIPEFLRERVGYVLRNLSEPIVLTNNILQGEFEDAEDTLRRFLINSTVGMGGVFDISTDLEIPYKKEDFGLTLASWGFSSGPYLVLPILGPSNVRDTFGRIGDYALDPINWWAYSNNDTAAYSYSRTGIQILDAKADNIEIIESLKKGSLDPYATFRTWYTERRAALVAKDREALDTPRPDDEDD
ncbi:MAG: VacJ family lipoprotein [Alphaproteobacteria bacterium]|nr:VacJ family lipoprotein [Alphaproteobacteria bacterium]